MTRESRMRVLQSNLVDCRYFPSSRKSSHVSFHHELILQSPGDFFTRSFIPQLYVHLLIHLWPTNSITGHAIFVADSVEIFL
jgi:hypothetical protein